MAISKIILNGVIQMDLTQDTVAANNLLQSYTAHGADGVAITGTAASGSTPTLQTKTKTYTPTTSQQTESVSADSGYDGLSAVNVTVNAMPTGELTAAETYSIANPTISVGNDGSIAVTGESHQIVNPVYTSGYIDTSATQYVTATVYGTYQQPIGTAGTPTATKGTVSNHSVSVTPSVTNTTGYITGSTKTGTAVTVSVSELVSGTYTVDSSGTKDVTNYASASVPAGTAGTPSASKGTVSNHSVSVTPSVTNATGWITGSTKTGTAVTVSASELVSGNLPITQNGNNIDCANYSTVSVNVSGGGSSVEVESIWPSSSSSSSLVFSNLKGNPTSFVINVDGGGLTPSATAKTDVIVFDGTNLFGQTIVSGTNAVVYDDTSYSKSYSNGTLTITSTGTAFDTDSSGYVMTYSYGGSASNIGTKDVQVGSGATSITFTDLPQEPLYWVCIFKSNFGTSTGYQRVIYIQKTGSTVYGHCMDSATRDSISYWTSSYSSGNLTITSQGTNAGGYFHQPGYYQLTYAYDDGSSGNYQSKTVYATSSQQVVQADSGYDALKQITIPAVTTTNLSASNILSGVTIQVGDAADSDRIASVTGNVVLQNYYTGSSAPSSSTGSNGDLYLQS